VNRTGRDRETTAVRGARRKARSRCLLVAWWLPYPGGIGRATEPAPVLAPASMFGALALVVATAGFVLGVTGSAIEAPIAGAAQSHPGRGPVLDPLPQSPRPGASGKNGLLPAWPQLHDRLVLDRTSVVAGVPIKGHLVVTNDGTRPIGVARGCSPSEEYGVALANGSYRQQRFVATDACGVPETLLIRPGTTSLPVTVATTYSVCSQSGSSQSGSQRVPACLPRGGMPSLPPGRYRATLEGTRIALPAPAPVVVTLRS
jgi:hypothetical protein